MREVEAYMDDGKVVIAIDIDADLIARAEEAGLNVSQTVDTALRSALSFRLRTPNPASEERARRWREDNAEAIRASNEELERNGLWSDGLRLF
jgi:antitoxin CcdA